MNCHEFKVNSQINPFQLPLEVKCDKRQPLDLAPFGNKLFKYKYSRAYDNRVIKRANELEDTD